MTERDVISDSFNAQLIPVTKSGPNFQAAIKRGKYNGKIKPTDPKAFGTEPYLSFLLGAMWLCALLIFLYDALNNQLC